MALAAVAGACGAADSLLPNVTNAANGLIGMRLFISPDSPARRQADAWRTSRPADARLMDRIAAQPIAQWIGGWSSLPGDITRAMDAARLAETTPIFVAYNIPNRDCGSYSAGGSATASAYRSWIRSFAAGLGGAPSIVILEPDAVPGASCLSASARGERFALLRDAVEVLKSARATVYLDAGHANWLSADETAARLTEAGIGIADGFSLNVSNYISTALNAAFGDAVSQKTGGKHYVIDTSRNGLGGNGSDWCNVPGQALGQSPTTNTGKALLDALLWIKQPGESDGTCNGGPSAGTWWADYALELARNGVVLASAR